MAIFERGETYVARASIRNRSGVATTPTSTKITIYDPCSFILKSSQSMVSDALGQYYYNYNITSTATYGQYKTRIETVTSGNTTYQYDEFFIMPWDAIPDVRQTMGVHDSKSINDDDIANIIWNSYLFALREVHSHHYNETPYGNPDTGVGFNGSNTSFQTKYHPIADINGDGIVRGNNVSCATDMKVTWINNAGHMADGLVSVIQAENGEITITQTGGVAIPSDNEGVYLDYWSEYQGFDSFLFQQAVVRLACHEISKRFASLDEITLANIRSNSPLIIVDPNMYWKEYRRYLKMNRGIIIGGVG
jgi:hypothetical protein